MGLILSPEVKMRHDGSRAILFSVNSTNSINDTAFRFLYPQQAVMLSLFDGKRDLNEIEKIVAFLFNLDLELASKEIESLLALHVNREQTIGSLIVDMSRIDPEKARIYDPKDFIISAGSIDMTDTRCKYPCSLIVLPTMRCFTSCRYCYADREGAKGLEEFSLFLFERLLRDANECGIEAVDFSGGDLFCRDDAFDLIRLTFQNKLYPNIPTKYPLSKGQVEQLAEMGLSTIQISIDALDADIIDNLVATKAGYGRKILQTIDYLGEANIKVRTNTVLTPYNVKDAIRLARYLAELPQVFKAHFTCYGRSLYRHEDKMFCHLEDITEFESELNEIKKEFPDKAIIFSGLPGDPYSGDKEKRASAFWDRAFCTANRRGVVVLPDGRVTICEELYFHPDFIIGDLNKHSLLEIWNSPRALKLAHPDQSEVHDGPCRDCSDFHICHEGLGRCIRDALKAYGCDRGHWPDPRCPRAPVGNRMA